jgi:small-conductance mechanosensitive channel
MPKKQKNDSLVNPKIWRHLVNFWTLVLYSVVVADFMTNNGQSELLGPISAIYVALLAIYTAQKEFERWHDYHVGRHPGEMYVIIWTAIIFLLLVLEVYGTRNYKLPSEVFTTYIVVVGILAITKRSKTDYLCKDKK